ncbi:MAG: ATP phosphoribosyltransferase regulatory subunit [Pseudomonadaceae bacterium]|nr:ATP phosphoribosyltransferase regulatory subunit [Pseudomonadaceae bacterium]
MKSHWRLPRGVDELLPPAAWQLELLRRKVLDLFDSWGFEYVDPPVIEYLDALLVGSGEDLDLQTLKVVDQVSGRQLGVRADMTSQAVRIDAHSMVTDEVQRLCYAGPVVFANPQITQNSRVPFKAGAEIFGAAGIDADAEVIALMLSTVQEAQIEEPVLLLGHMGIYLGLVAQLIAEGSLAAEDEGRLFTCVQRKSQADIRALLQKTPCSEMMTALPLMMGEPAVMGGVHQQLSGAPESVLQALEELQSLAEQVSELYPGLRLRLDVSELSGYGYHNGPVYAVYHPTHGSALSQGGRYDDVGEVFGRLRPATGFDVNLKLLINTATNRNIIFAPYVPPQQRSALLLEIATLRAAGERVQCALSSEERPPSACQRVLAQVEGKWQVVANHD